MSKKGNKKTANKSLETLKRKQYARGGRRGNPPARKAAQPVQELKQIKSAPIPLKVSDQKPTKIGGNPTPLPKPRPSLFSDPVKVGGIKNPKDIKLPEPSRSTGGGRGQPISDLTPIKSSPMDENTRRRVESGMGGGREALLGNQPLGGGEQLKQEVGKFNQQISNQRETFNQDNAKALAAGTTNFRRASQSQSQDVAQQSMVGRGSKIIPQTVENNNGYKAGTGVADGINKSQGQSQQSMMGSGFTGLTPAQLAKLAEDYGGGYNPNQDGQVDNGQETTASDETEPGGTPEGERLTLLGKDGNEYSTQAELDAANHAYDRAIIDAKQGTVTVPDSERSTGGSPTAPLGIEYTAPVAELERMTTERVMKPVPESEQWANKLVDQYPELTTSQREELRAWGVSNRQGSEEPFPAFFSGMDFLKGLEAANNMEYDTTTRAPEGTETGTDDIQKLGDATDATSSTVTAQGLTAEQGTAVAGTLTGEGQQAERYDATTTSGLMDKTVAAQMKGDPTKAVAGQVDVTAQAPETQRDDAAEKAALGTFADRPEYKDYATAARDDSDYGFDTSTVDEPQVTISDGVTIPQSKVDEIRLDAEKRGLDPTDALKAYSEAMVQRTVQKGDAAQKGYTPRMGETPEETAARAETYGADYTPQGGNTEIDATPAYKKAAERVAQVGEAASRKAAELGTAPSADLEGRQAITGEAPKGDASQIGGVPTAAAASMDAVTGVARTAAAEDMMAVVADVKPEVTAAIAEDPAKYLVQIDENPDPQTVAAIAALPVEALVSTQMESLLAGMEEGKTPAWARPAVAAMEAKMAQRGLSTSTVGRDALFNAIIQSALPIAQSNAQALQQRAQQNLSNEQQANLSTAQNTMQVRMQNLANRQTHASQTASMAQQIKVQQGTFEQQAVMTTAQQQQETSLTNAQLAQQRAQQESSQRQQTAIANLSTGAQADLANLQAMNAAGSQNMTADQQSRLASYNAQVNKVMRQAELSQDMEKANLSPALQVEMQRVSEMNAASKDTMTAEQTERLTNLQTLIDFRKTDAQFAQQMDLANMSNEQQIELAMLQDKAATDSANFTADNAFSMQELNQKVARSVRQAELNSRMEEVNLDSKLKIELSELAEKNTTSRANMSAEQQARLANLNVLVDFRKTNAAMAQQMDLANLGNEQQMELANLQERSATDAANFTEANRGRTQELNTYVQVMSQNEQLKQNADMANLSMEEKINLANLSSQSQADMASMSAENVQQLQVYEKKMAAGQVNAQLAQAMGLANLSNEQSAGMFNAQMNANFDMSAMSNEQQMEIANSKFMQTMTATKFSADQQTALSNASLLAQTDLANADARTRVSVENAKNFLTKDMANLSNAQQAIVMDQQIAQQALLSDQAAQNAAKQFGATSQNQIDQFMISQSNNMMQFNTSAQNAMESFNVTEANRTAAIEAGNTLQADTFTAQLEADISKFNASIDNQRDTWNASNAQAVEQSNISWRRQANTIDTAAANAANQQNVQNAYNISALDQTQMWQQLRDEAAYVRQSYENNEQREAQLIATAIGNESGAAKGATTSTSELLGLINSYRTASTQWKGGYAGGNGGGGGTGPSGTGGGYDANTPKEQ